MGFLFELISDFVEEISTGKAGIPEAGSLPKKCRMSRADQPCVITQLTADKSGTGRRCWIGALRNFSLGG
jgi:hypothetical protein